MSVNIPKSEHHKHRLLARSGLNEIVFCYGCKMYHVHYETISLDLTLKGLFSLMEYLQKCIQENAGICDDDIRWIELATPSKNIRLYFSINDCKSLAGLIVQSIKTIRDHPPQSKWN
ncbi:MAG: DUF6686 family protein [Bacteroidota bacterium]